ncbi:AAA family ATPase [Saccharibacter sp. 17.LH.SD]|uniref:PhoH family protein n=1 Tax=Saccharibacter sp. 17.LH.SD TaxID=2689393 RepID=UPI001370E4EA|nr:PhoH family protein [Saccharibacter sp. 17.LH.SD]MXV44507.1 AAA family ATPase [Saccharibacter sp. 17.LH.SD]
MTSSTHASSASPTIGEQRTTTLRFHDNHLLQHLVGDHDRHLARLERHLDVQLVCRGNRIAVSGNPASVEQTKTALLALYQQLEQGHMIDGEQIDGVVRLTSLPAHRRTMPTPRTHEKKVPSSQLEDLPSIRTKRGNIAPRSHGQAAYMAELAQKELVFGIGPAGTGKTYLAVAQAVAMFQAGQVDRIILSRPAVEAGERLGFLPGDMREKIDPYLRPLYDALHDMMPGDQLTRRMSNGEIEVAPLAFMRGRTLGNAYVILDEAQNTTPAQMKMFLTRMGPNTRMAITGDMSQIDLPKGVTSGLKDAVTTLENVQGISICRLRSEDVVRHPLVARIVDAYDRTPHKTPPSFLQKRP